MLDFDPDAESDVDTDEGDGTEGRDLERAPELTKEELNKWQKSLLEVSVLKKCDMSNNVMNSEVPFVLSVNCFWLSAVQLV